MWKLALILLIAAASSTTAQTIEVECKFELESSYECILEGVTITDRSANLRITGEHLGNRTNDDVTFVRIFRSNTPFIHPQFFDIFRNMNELYIQHSGLQSLELPRSDVLRYLSLTGNNITRVPSRALANVPNIDSLSMYSNQIDEIEEFAFENDVLRYLDLDRNRFTRIPDGAFANIPNLDILSLEHIDIEEIEENAFDGLRNVKYLYLGFNRLTELSPRTLQPLAMLNYINLVENSFTRLEANTFANNTALEYLYLTNNRINEVSPQFTQVLRSLPQLEKVDFTGNQCINLTFFLLGDESSLVALNNHLQPCFLNFAGQEVSDEKNIAMQFSGPLRIIDQFGNILASV